MPRCTVRPNDQRDHSLRVSQKKMSSQTSQLAVNSQQLFLEQSGIIWGLLYSPIDMNWNESVLIMNFIFHLLGSLNNGTI